MMRNGFMKLKFLYSTICCIFRGRSVVCILRTGKSDTAKVGHGQRIRASGFTRWNIGRIEARVTRRQIQLMGSLWSLARVAQ